MDGNSRPKATMKLGRCVVCINPRTGGDVNVGECMSGHGKLRELDVKACLRPGSGPVAKWFGGSDKKVPGKWATRMLRGGTSQYFQENEAGRITDHFPRDENDFDINACVRAGVKARFIEDRPGGADYAGLSRHFTQLSNLRAGRYPDRQAYWERCRQAFMTGFDPDHRPAPRSLTYPDRNIDLQEARWLAGKLEGPVHDEFLAEKMKLEKILK